MSYQKKHVRIHVSTNGVICGADIDGETIAYEVVKDHNHVFTGLNPGFVKSFSVEPGPPKKSVWDEMSKVYSYLSVSKSLLEDLDGGLPSEKSFGFQLWNPLAAQELATVELLDSSNPFAQALDAWQTGKAGWIKGASFRITQEEEE